MKMKMKMKMMLVLLLLSLYLINHLDASPVNRHSRSLFGILLRGFKGVSSFGKSLRNQPRSFFSNTEPRLVRDPLDPSLPVNNIKPSRDPLDPSLPVKPSRDPLDPSLPVNNIKPSLWKEPDPKYPRLSGGASRKKDLRLICKKVCAHVVDSAFSFAEDTGSPDLCKKKLANAGVQALCAAACKGVRDGLRTAISAAARAAYACGDAASLADPPALAPV